METPQRPQVNEISCSKLEFGLQTQELSEGKRSFRHDDESDSMNTTRKYICCSKKLNQNSQFTSKNSKNQRSDVASVEAKDEALIQLSVIQQQHSVVSSSLPVRQRVGYLLDSYQSANYTLEHRKLIQTQIKLDELLDFMRLHRQKGKGQLFSIIRKTMRQNYEIDIDLTQLKQILYLMPQFYSVSQRKDEQGRFDILLSLPQFIDLQPRKTDFRKKLFMFLTENQAFTKNRAIKIPMYDFKFQPKSNPVLKSQKITNSNPPSRSLMLFNKSSSLSKINPFDAFKPDNSQNFQMLLMNKIRQNEQRIEQQKQKQKQIRFGWKQLLIVLDQIPKIFKKREKSSMFKSSIIQDLDLSLNIKFQALVKIFDILMEKYSDFFKVIEHKSGSILQIQLKYYNSIRNKIMRDEGNFTVEKEDLKNQQPMVQTQKVQKVQKVQNIGKIKQIIAQSKIKNIGRVKSEQKNNK